MLDQEEEEEDKTADQKSGILRLILLQECGFYHELI